MCEVEHQSERSGTNSLMNGIGYKANCLGFCPLDLVFKTSQTTVPSKLVPAAEHQCLDVVNNAHDSVNETEPSATMLAPSNDWKPSDPCSSSQSSRPMDEYVPISMLQAPLDVCISVHSCDTSCSSSQSSQSYTTATTAAINDPAKWTVTDNLREYWALHGPTRCYNNDGRYSASKRKDAGGVSRMVTENMFKRTFFKMVTQ